MGMLSELRKLGYRSYKNYLESEVWANFKQRYRAAGRKVQCEVCNSALFQLHHLTYERVGREDLSDVVPLCRLHHEAVHFWLKAYAKGDVASTAVAIRWLKSGTVPPPPKAKNFSQKARKERRHYRCPKCGYFRKKNKTLCKKCQRGW